MQTVTGTNIIPFPRHTPEEQARQLEYLKSIPVDESDRDYFNIWTGKGSEMARAFEPRGISDVVVRPNGERVAEINSSRLEP